MVKFHNDTVQDVMCFPFMNREPILPNIYQVLILSTSMLRMQTLATLQLELNVLFNVAQNSYWEENKNKYKGYV